MALIRPMLALFVTVAAPAQEEPAGEPPPRQEARPTPGRLPGVRHVTPFDPERPQATFKVFTHLLADDGRVITKGPGGSYPHHRGVFLGWNRVRCGGRSSDFWGGDGGRCTIRHESYRDVGGDRFTAVAVWRDREGGAVLREERTVKVGEDEETGARLVDFDVRLEALADEVGLAGDAHHGGFQVRAVQEVHDRADEVRYVLPEGARELGDDRWEQADWAALSFPAGDRTFTVVHMDHPDNPRPIRYSTRPYGRFGSFFPAVLEEGEPLRLRYRIAVLDHRAGDGVRAGAGRITHPLDGDIGEVDLRAGYRRLYREWTR